jgi:maltooligosyltrehalose trehalohydrolase
MSHHNLQKEIPMQLLPMDILGAHERTPNQLDFGIFLPWVSAAAGNALSVAIIHERDQFLQNIPPLVFPLQHSVHPTYGDYWSGSVNINAANRVTPASAWGTPGTYVYRYQLRSPLLVEPLDWIVDPFAREFGIGRQAALTLGYADHVWDSNVEQTWRTPDLRDLVVYEMMLQEFAGGLDAAQARLEYLRDLGINCLEIMPVANVDRSVDWGFEPIGLFGVDERFGNRASFQQFVDAAHRLGMAVVLDMIYGHAGRNFAYEYVYSNLQYRQNPFMGPFGDADMFGVSTDYRRTFVQDFYYTVNHFWLDRYRVDGIRYDCVPNYWDGPAGVGYANLVYNTYQTVAAGGPVGHWKRFFNNSQVNLIQCAEQLQKPVEAVEKTYSNCVWQNETLAAANDITAGIRGAITDFGMRLGLLGYPRSATLNSDTLPKTAFQYLENHDHSRFICRFGTDDLYKNVLREGRRENWFKVQPYLIALLLSTGVPLLWQGQEIMEKYDVPDDGAARIGTLRPVRWELFYDEPGRNTIGLIRNLLKLRNSQDVFRCGEYYFHNDWNRWQSNGLLLFSRWIANKYALVALNFTDADLDTVFWFPIAGNYQDCLHGRDSLNNVVPYQPVNISVPSNYGKVWLHI